MGEQQIRVEQKSTVKAIVAKICQSGDQFDAKMNQTNKTLLQKNMEKLSIKLYKQRTNESNKYCNGVRLKYFPPFLLSHLHP